MNRLCFSRYAFSCVIATMLTGCGGSQQPIGAPGALGAHGKKQSQTFSFTGSEQTFTVPKGVTDVTVTASGASGSLAFGSGPSALGGLVKATIPVTPGENLAVFVGGAGIPEGDGYNGGAASGSSGSCSGSGCGGGGGGGSDVRQSGDSLKSRVVVAGGGGGQACCSNAAQGGAGGGLHSAAGANGADEGTGRYGIVGGQGGKGGRQSRGGRGGKGGTAYTAHCPGTKGDNGALGNGGQGGTSCEAASGGGGGGGYYGGGGGGGGCGICGQSNSYAALGGGGGGGSSYVKKGATRVTNIRGAAAPGNGQIVISWQAT